MRRAGVAHVRHAPVGLLANQVLRRRRQAPAGHDELPALLALPDHRREIVRVDFGLGFQIAKTVDDGQRIEEAAHGFLRLGLAVEIAHRIKLPAAERVLGRSVGHAHGSVCQDQFGMGVYEVLGIGSAAEEEGNGIAQDTFGRDLGILAATNMRIEPAVDAIQQRTKSAFGHQHPNMNRVGGMVGLLLGCAAATHD